jgi:hypothetical protein
VFIEDKGPKRVIQKSGSVVVLDRFYHFDGWESIGDESRQSVHGVPHPQQEPNQDGRSRKHVELSPLLIVVMEKREISSAESPCEQC